MEAEVFLRLAATCLERRMLLPKGAPRPRAFLTISTCNLRERFFSNFPEARTSRPDDLAEKLTRLDHVLALQDVTHTDEAQNARHAVPH